jgi:hypothetical protein
MIHQWAKSRFLICFFQISLIAILITGCVPGLSVPTQPPAVAAPTRIPTVKPSPTITPTATATPPPLAETTFQVEVPAQTPADEKVSLDVLDEVTGLPLNILRYSMDRADATHYSIRIPVTIGSVIRYRYVRESNPVSIEYNSQGNQVRYRLYFVNTPGMVKDAVSGWNDFPYKGGVGRIQGQVTDADTNLPIPDVMVTAGGTQTITSSDGSFLLEGLSPGTHNLVAYSIEGSYQPFAQGAVVAADSTTPAPMQLTPTKKVKVSFIVHLPKGSITGVPLRLVGNIYPLGNTFADLQGGISSVADRAPVMKSMPDGTYLLAVELPAGLDLRYKYSLGDGFWNAELTNDGQFNVRQLIVPDADLTINDTIESWGSPDRSPITFNVKVPENTPSTDVVSIQFNPYNWTEAIPMWPLGNNQWTYTLNSPLNLLGNVKYRFCRNDQCGVADDEATQDPNAQVYAFTPGKDAQNLQNEVKNWTWMAATGAASQVVSAKTTPRGPQFVAGVELSSNYSPTWQAYLGAAAQNLQAIGANWVILTPTWHYTNQDPPILENEPGKDPLWPDTLQMAATFQTQKLNVAIFPQSRFDQDINAWAKYKRSDGWWNSWFARYRTFLLNYADLATAANAKALIIGEEGMLPALMNGMLPNGSPSGVPLDADARWNKMIKDIRARFKGTLILALYYPAELTSLPKFISSVDQVYVLVSAPLNKSKATQAGMTAEFLKILDKDLKPIKDTYKKPILIGIDYPSISEASTGCVNVNGKCGGFDVLDQPSQDEASGTLDLKAQVDIYNAVLVGINQRSWVSGIISRSYYPPASLQDKSSSIHGKPAADVLWYWFPKLLSAAKK